jgi:hypothetical protein
MKILYDKNAHKESNRKYYIKNKDIVIKRTKKYYNDNKDKIKDWRKTYSKKYREINKDKLKEKRIINKEYIKNYQLKYKYDISIEQYEQMKTSQNNRCAICDNNFEKQNKQGGYSKNVCIDHNHKTGKIRELLCPNCNKALGFLNENISTIKKMIIYLNKWGIE